MLPGGASLPHLPLEPTAACLLARAEPFVPYPIPLLRSSHALHERLLSDTISLSKQETGAWRREDTEPRSERTQRAGRRVQGQAWQGALLALPSILLTVPGSIRRLPSTGLPSPGGKTGKVSKCKRAREWPLAPGCQPCPQPSLWLLAAPQQPGAQGEASPGRADLASPQSLLSKLSPLTPGATTLGWGPGW